MPVLGIRVSSAHTLHRFNRAAETLDLIERSRLAPLGCGTLFPCQIKQYMDFGFKALFRYA